MHSHDREKIFANRFSNSIAKLKKSQNNNWFERDAHQNQGSFQEAVSTIFTVAQFFGIMPVINMTNKTASKLRFKWTAFRTVLSVIIQFFVTCYAVITLYVFFTESNFDRVASAVFCASSSCGMIMFLVLARKWPDIMRQWEDIESILPKYRNRKDEQKLASQIKWCATAFIILGITEHILALMTSMQYVIICKPNEDLVREFLTSHLFELFQITSYAVWKVILGKFTNIIATFGSIYLHFFITTVSIGISSRFKQLNQEMNRVRGERTSEKYWKLRRSEFRKLSSLCARIDDSIGLLTVISFAANLYFICVQLLRSIRPMPSIIHAIYFYVSLFFLIGRTTLITMSASAIYDESKKTVDVLRAVPSSSWCIEVQRFVEEVVNSKVALSGMRFFYLHRSIILNIAGTIVTYELVLIQFKTGNEEQPLCV